MKADCIVVLGGPAWEDSANQTSMQSARALSTELPVLYVSRSDPRPIRQRLRELGQGRRRRRTLPASMRDSGGALHVIRLPAWTDWVPLVRPEFARRALESVFMRAIEKALRSRNLSRPALISYWWMFPELVARAGWQYRVFDMIDRHWGYGYLTSESEIRRNLSLALATARASDRVVAVSDSLAEEVRSLTGVVVDCVPNALDLVRVQTALRQNGRADQGHNGRHAVFVGGWNDRVDFELFEDVTKGLPDWRFTVIGAEARIEQSNVEFLGDMDYEGALRAMASASVGLLPFRDNDYTRSSSFLKAFDYLAAGLTVLATPLPGTIALAREFPDHVVLAEPGVWIDRLKGDVWEQHTVLPLADLPGTHARLARVLRPLDAELADELDRGEGVRR